MRAFLITKSLWRPTFELFGPRIPKSLQPNPRKLPFSGDSPWRPKNKPTACQTWQYAFVPTFQPARMYSSDTYPAKVSRLVVPTTPGTPPDVISRIVANELYESDGWKVVVENRGGALQTLAATDVLKQEPDGYTLLAMSVCTGSIRRHSRRCDG
jgi:hypothetical protein